MGFAIFFSAAPLSFLAQEGQITWLFQVAPGAAVLSALTAAGLWAAYFSLINRSRSL